MRRWAVIVDDPDAWRAHVLAVDAETAEDAKRAGAAAASHADMALTQDLQGRSLPAGALGSWGHAVPEERISDPVYAIAFPIAAGERLDVDSIDWPKYEGPTMPAHIVPESMTSGLSAGDPLRFVIQDHALVTWRPLDEPEGEAE